MAFDELNVLNLSLASDLELEIGDNFVWEMIVKLLFRWEKCSLKFMLIFLLQ